MAFLTIPNSFTPNTLIESAKMNANFQAIVDALSGNAANLDVTLTGVLRAASPRFTTSINDSNGNELIALSPTASAVNEVAITNAATGNAPSIAASGGDANINLRLAGKGTGRVIIPGYPYTLEVSTTSTGNAGTGLDALHSYTLAANSLASDGDYLEITYSGTFATNDNDKRIDIFIDGQSIFNTGAFDFDGAGSTNQWTITITAVRVSATTIRASMSVLFGQVTVNGATTLAGNAVLTGRNNAVTVSNLTSNPVNIVLAAEGISDNDIVNNLAIIKLTQR